MKKIETFHELVDMLIENGHEIYLYTAQGTKLVFTPSAHLVSLKTFYEQYSPLYTENPYDPEFQIVCIPGQSELKPKVVVLPYTLLSDEQFIGLPFKNLK